MALKKRKPTTPSMRGRVDLVVKYFQSDKKQKTLMAPLKGPKGRSWGKVSMRHQSRGVKKHYRLIDFKRDKFDVPGVVASIEYDPNRNVSISLVKYVDGEKRFILTPRELKVGDKIISSETAPIKAGNSLKIANIPLAVPIHNIEIHPGKGGQMVRSAGTFSVITAKEGKYANISMPSGEVRKVLLECRATIGELGNEDFKNRKIGKAGRKIYMGIRPTVRGISYSNPRDHAHGGSYRTAGIGRNPVSPTGVPAKGFKTRKRKHTLIYKVKDRRKK